LALSATLAFDAGRDEPAFARDPPLRLLVPRELRALLPELPFRDRVGRDRDELEPRLALELDRLPPVADAPFVVLLVCCAI
jgi:hypothetical protein